MFEHNDYWWKGLWGKGQNLGKISFPKGEPLLHMQHKIILYKKKKIYLLDTLFFLCIPKVAN